MSRGQDYFFCGVGGSGMTPLALIVQARGGTVAGSDRSRDQGRNLSRFDYLAARGVQLFPQDGGGVTHAGQTLVVSTAVEETIPDVQAARRVGAPIVTRAALLASLFNAAPIRIGIAGTSGKSTTTAMIGWILTEVGKDPTIVNGAEMKNFMAPDAPFAGARVGTDRLFIAEVDESDGSIAQFSPTVAVVNNISLDHKTMDELRVLFADFVDKAELAVLNLDNAETAVLAARPGLARVVTYSLNDARADLRAIEPVLSPGGSRFRVVARTAGEAEVTLQVPGLHNVSNALAAIGATMACGVGLAEAAAALGRFCGIRRRMEVAGTAAGVTVFDDFAHNPDKITATLAALHAFPGRLLVMFQPHGYGPLKLMRGAFIDTFVRGLAEADVLVMPEPVYFGGTVDRSVGSQDIARGVAAGGRTALALSDRAACGERLIELARPGDRIVVMGARDDTLSVFAAELVERLAERGQGQSPSVIGPVARPATNWST